MSPSCEVYPTLALKRVNKNLEEFDEVVTQFYPELCKQNGEEI